MTAMKDGLQGEEGQRFGPYVLERALGAGVFCEVWIGRHEVLKVPHTIKVLFDEAFQAQLLATENVRFQLEHPRIVKVWDAAPDQTPFLVAAEFIEGESLRARIARDGALDAEAALRISLQILEALEYAHDQGTCHQDLRPGCILLDADGDVHVSDFGIGAIRAGMVPGMVASGSQEGERGIELSYLTECMSPELLRGEPADPRSDLFSLGKILVAMLTGQADRWSPGALTDLELPQQLVAIVDRAIAEDPAARCQTAGELIAELRPMVTELRNLAGERRLQAMQQEHLVVEKIRMGVDAARLTARTAMEASDWGGALDGWQQVMELDPDHTEARYGVLHAQALVGKLGRVTRPGGKRSRFPWLPILVGVAALACIGLIAWSFLGGSQQDGVPTAAPSAGAPAGAPGAGADALGGGSEPAGQIPGGSGGVADDPLQDPAQLVRATAEFEFVHMGVDPDFSPDGRRVAWADKWGVVYWRDLDSESGKNQKLFSGGRSPRWSPDADAPRLVLEKRQIPPGETEGLPAGIVVLEIVDDGVNIEVLTEELGSDPYFVNQGAEIVYRVGESHRIIGADRMSHEITAGDYQRHVQDRRERTCPWKIAGSYRDMPGVWLVSPDGVQHNQIWATVGLSTVVTSPGDCRVYFVGGDSSGLLRLSFTPPQLFLVEGAAEGTLEVGARLDVYPKIGAEVTAGALRGGPARWRGTLQVEALEGDTARCVLVTRVFRQTMVGGDLVVPEGGKALLGSIRRVE